MNKKKLMFSGLTLSFVALTLPLTLTSCSNTIFTYKIKEININSIQKPTLRDAGNNDKKVSGLNISNVSIEKAIYGSNFNDGNYLFVYGTRVSDSFRTFLYGENGNYDDPDINSNNTVKEQFLYSSKFLNEFFAENAIGNGLFENNPQTINKNVKILLYADMPPVRENVSNIQGLDGIMSPFDVFSQEDVLKEANKDQDGKYDLETLPDEFRFKINTFKRYDDGAVLYRDFITYLKSIRPNVEMSQDAGMIAFKKNVNPKYFPIESDYLSIQDYYQNTTSN